MPVASAHSFPPGAVMRTLQKSLSPVLHGAALSPRLGIGHPGLRPRGGHGLATPVPSLRIIWAIGTDRAVREFPAAAAAKEVRETAPLVARRMDLGLHLSQGEGMLRAAHRHRQLPLLLQPRLLLLPFHDVPADCKKPWNAKQCAGTHRKNGELCRIHCAHPADCLGRQAFYSCAQRGQTESLLFQIPWPFRLLLGQMRRYRVVRCGRLPLPSGVAADLDVRDHCVSGIASAATLAGSARRVVQPAHLIGVIAPISNTQGHASCHRTSKIWQI
mmetsp:Transcript_117868/g.328305  ORF Transcript_117868/g.328305 Transcript_117868/m.328305 type:complete len:273 (-) Transcript_117868:879-1697(-)